MSRIKCCWFLVLLLCVFHRVCGLVNVANLRFSHKLSSRLTRKSGDILLTNSPPLSLNIISRCLLTATKHAKGPSSSYSSQSITVLEGLEPVRLRPGMYIGSTGSQGLHHLVYEIVDNSVDEALAGYCTEINITLLADGMVRVADNGRGIPCDLHTSTGKSTLETVLCVLHAGGKFGGDRSGYSISGGLHGVGLSVVNALSELMHVSSFREGFNSTMSFAKGVPISSLMREASVDGSRRGTTVTFKPDPTIFKTEREYQSSILLKRIEELAYLNPGLRFNFLDCRPNITSSSSAAPVKAISFLHEGGLVEMLTARCQSLQPIHPKVPYITIKKTVKDVTVEAALQWSENCYSSESITSFANNINTGDGGSHVEGLRAAISKLINSYAKKTGKNKQGTPSIPGEFIREGMSAILSVKLPQPEFEGQTKARLGNPEIRGIVESIVTEALTELFEAQPSILNAIVSKATEAYSAALAAKAVKDLTRKKSALTTSVLPGKLADCSSTDPSDCELFIVEGDSAAGSAKLGRNRHNQAILPLRGKILNIEKSSDSKLYQNKEVQALITALGLGTKDAAFDKNKLRYNRTIIMTDADVDGSHIRLLLLTFLYRYQPQLIKDGHVYVACPPLYKVSNGKRESPNYFYSSSEYNEFVKANPPTSSTQVQRFKGLGEMMPTQLWETTMDPTSRVLKQVVVGDPTDCEAVFTMLMGNVVAPRKQFITQNMIHFVDV